MGDEAQRVRARIDGALLRRLMSEALERGCKIRDLSERFCSNELNFALEIYALGFEDGKLRMLDLEEWANDDDKTPTN